MIVKGIGGGVPGQKIYFGLFLRKFCVLSPPLYRNEKFSSVGPKIAQLGQASRGHLEAVFTHFGGIGLENTDI